jgi:phage/plasmid-like protein (TIGR03299 family)
MSHEITSTDRLVLARNPAWHGLGQVLPQAETVRRSFELAGLGWTVDRHPIYVDHVRSIPSGKGPIDLKDSPRMDDLSLSADRVALVRSDTSDTFEVVGKGFEVLQNAELADLIESLSAAKAMQTADTAGSLRGGRNVFALVPRSEFFAGTGGDPLRTYVLFANAHDGTGSLTIVPTSVRVVCANTLAMATAGIRLRHTASLRDRIAEAVIALKKADAAGEAFKATVKRLASVKMDDEDRRVFFLRVYESAFGVLPGRPTSGKYTEAESRKLARAQETVGAWLANLDSSRNTGQGTEGTVWHALNAATEWSDHTRRVKGDSREARVFSNLLGTSANFKAGALQLAVQAAG